MNNISKEQIVVAVVAPLVFPEGFSVGHGERKSNLLTIERDGQDNPVLRGSSVAGVLRAAAEQDGRYTEGVDFYFGKALENREDRQESCVVCEDSFFKNETDETMHNRICRHTGSVSDENKGLFAIEQVSPGVECDLFFYVKIAKVDQDKANEARELACFLASSLHGALLGGHASRGVGRCQLKNGEYSVQVFDLEKTDDVAAYLDLMYADKKVLPRPERLKVNELDQSKKFAVQVLLGIPAGQDVLFAEGNDMFPISTTVAGQERWKIPGSTFRGIFRSWMSRLAARDGEQLVDNAERYQERGDKKDVEDEDRNDAIQSLFGTLQHKGRIHFTDAFSSVKCNNVLHIQKRRHVVIDRFTGGTNDGKLFENGVLVNPDGDMKFTLEVSICNASEKEVRWLEKTFTAMQLGILRFGSSKAAGRLEVCSQKIISNPNHFSFNILKEGK